MTDIPWDKLGIGEPLRTACAPDAPRPLRLAAAKMALPATADAQIAALYVLAADDDADIRDAATASVKAFPNLVGAVGQRTHPKVLELVAQVRAEPELDQKLLLIRNTNDRTAVRIAGRASAELCAQLCDNHERLLITPDVVLALHQNPACTDLALERAISFLRMQDALPALPAERPRAGEAKAPKPPKAAPAPAAAPAAAFDLDAEIEAALAGKASPMLEERKRLELFALSDAPAPGVPVASFEFNFEDKDDFSLDLLDEEERDPDEDKKIAIEKRIASMSVGQKIKLAYLGNKSTRAILIRDRNKQVSHAVLKSGRVSDAEALAFAGNRSLNDELLREIANNREWMRKYPVKVALANNPKTPASVAVSLVNVLHSNDLASLSRNKNVSSVVFTLAQKLLKARAKEK